MFVFLDKSNDQSKGLSPTKSTKLSRGRPVRGNLVHSNTFTAKDIDPTNRFLTGRDSSTKNEAKRREAVWDLFQSETAFLLDHLMVLKHVCKLFDSFSVLWDIHLVAVLRNLSGLLNIHFLNF